MLGSYGNSPRFIGARPSRFATRLGYQLAKLMARAHYRVSLHVQPGDLARLDAVRDERLILMPNHPAPHDWLTMGLLSAELKLQLFYMTAHEQLVGFKQWWLPRFGAYSIRRGGWGDLSSIAATLAALDQPGCGIVMFPEGRCSFSSCGTLDFKPGAVRLGFNYLRRRYSTGRKMPDLFLVPITIKYEYLHAIADEIRARIDRLDRRLGTTTTGTPTQRMQELARKIVSQLERRHGVGGSDGWWQRTQALCTAVLSAEEQAACIRMVRPGITDRACNLRQALAIDGRRRGISGKSAYEAAYFPTLLVLVLESLGALDFSAPLNAVEQADLLCSLERIVDREPDPLLTGRRRAVIRVGESVNLKHRFADYRRNRFTTMEHIRAELRASVEQNLSDLSVNQASTESKRRGLVSHG